MVVCRAADPAAVNVCLLVAFGNTATVAAKLYLQPQVVQLLQGYLFWVAENFVAPQFAGILGSPLGPNSGGMLASRTIYQWLYGERAEIHQWERRGSQWLRCEHYGHVPVCVTAELRPSCRRSMLIQSNGGFPSRHCDALQAQSLWQSHALVTGLLVPHDH